MKIHTFLIALVGIVSLVSGEASSLRGVAPVTPLDETSKQDGVRGNPNPSMVEHNHDVDPNEEIIEVAQSSFKEFIGNAGYDRALEYTEEDGEKHKDSSDREWEGDSPTETEGDDDMDRRIWIKYDEEDNTCTASWRKYANPDNEKKTLELGQAEFSHEGTVVTCTMTREPPRSFFASLPYKRRLSSSKLVAKWSKEGGGQKEVVWAEFYWQSSNELKVVLEREIDGEDDGDDDDEEESTPTEETTTEESTSSSSDSDSNFVGGEV